MKLQAIIGAGIGFFDNRLHPKKVARHIIGPSFKDADLKDTTTYFTNADKIDSRSEDSKGQNFYLSIIVEDLQEIYWGISRKGYTLIDSKITQNQEVKQKTK